MTNNITLEEVYNHSFDFLRKYILDNIPNLKDNVYKEAIKELDNYLLNNYPTFFIEDLSINIDKNNEHTDNINIQLSIVNGI